MPSDSSNLLEEREQSVSGSCVATMLIGLHLRGVPSPRRPVPAPRPDAPAALSPQFPASAPTTDTHLSYVTLPSLSRARSVGFRQEGGRPRGGGGLINYNPALTIHYLSRSARDNDDPGSSLERRFWLKAIASEKLPPFVSFRSFRPRLKARDAVNISHWTRGLWR